MRLVLPFVAAALLPGTAAVCVTYKDTPDRSTCTGGQDCCEKYPESTAQQSDGCQCCCSACPSGQMCITSIGEPVPPDPDPKPETPPDSWQGECDMNCGSFPCPIGYMSISGLSEHERKDRSLLFATEPGASRGPEGAGNATHSAGVHCCCVYSGHPP